MIDKRFWMDRAYQNNLDIVLNEGIKNNWDAVIIVFGSEGSGKSTITSQSAYYLDRNINIDHCVFTPTQLDEAIEKLPPGSSIQWDEAITGANAQQFASEMQQRIISKFTQIRKKKLKIFMCFPYLDMLRRYFLSRCLFGIYVFAKGFDDRGHAFMFNQNKLLHLHYLMKEKYRYNPNLAISKVRSDLYFKYPNYLCYNEKEYDTKKDKSRVENENQSKQNIWKQRFGIAFKVIQSKKPITIQELADKIGVSKRGLYQVISDMGMNEVS
jgi:hypothetical protein